MSERMNLSPEDLGVDPEASKEPQYFRDGWSAEKEQTMQQERDIVPPDPYLGTAEQRTGHEHLMQRVAEFITDALNEARHGKSVERHFNDPALSSAVGEQISRAVAAENEQQHERGRHITYHWQPQPDGTYSLSIIANELTPPRG